MTVKIDPKLVRPTDWDKKAVADDLREYVTRSRLTKGTPVIRPIEGALKVISGAPFLRAAQEAQPPLAEMVCEIEADERTIQSLGLSTISPTELLDRYPENVTYDALEMLAFTRVLSAEERNAIEVKILAFFREVTAHPSIYGGNSSSLSPFEWDQLNTKVRWIWKRDDQPGPRVLLFLKLLHDINRSVAPLRSWNGLAIDVMSP